jgi:hypothetical protein
VRVKIVTKLTSWFPLCLSHCTGPHTPQKKFPMSTDECVWDPQGSTLHGERKHFINITNCTEDARIALPFGTQRIRIRHHPSIPDPKYTILWPYSRSSIKNLSVHGRCLIQSCGQILTVDRLSLYPQCYVLDGFIACISSLILARSVHVDLSGMPQVGKRIKVVVNLNYMPRVTITRDGTTLGGVHTIHRHKSSHLYYIEVLI